MLHIYNCIAAQHDPRLVAVAVVIGAIGSYTTFALMRQTSADITRLERLTWAVAGILATSTAIWATHFIAMLAFEPPTQFGFAVLETTVSFLAAVVLVGLGLGIVVLLPTLTGHLVGGSIVGLAIPTMHFIGMSAYRVQGVLLWDTQIVSRSVVSGVVLGSLSMAASSSTRACVRQLAPLLLLCAVCCSHFIGMSAVTVVFDPQVLVPLDSLDSRVLSVLTANAALLIIGLALSALRLWRVNRQRNEAENQRLRHLTDIALEGLVICDGNTITGVNSSLVRITGLSRDHLIDGPLQRILPNIQCAEIPHAYEIEAIVKGGGVAIPVRLIAQPIAIRAKALTVIAVRDQRERLRAELEMHRLAHRDPLTGLANRHQFNRALDFQYALSQVEGATFVLLSLDLDRFKLVNDTLGHGMGDALLRRVAERLLRAVGDTGIVARLVGDEFAILIAGAIDLSAIQAVAEQAIDLLARPFLIDGHILNIGASIGIAVAPGDGRQAEQLLSNADLALYGAKADGRGRYRMFEPSMNARIQARRSLELDLRRAIAREEFMLHYQPQVDARTNRFDGAEALIRWHHPERGLISPLEFIPLAEDTGLIGSLGEWVLRTACAEALSWPPHLVVAVNLSPMQFRDVRLAATIRSILIETGLPAARLELEITEGSLLQDEQRTLTILHELRELGVRLSMDDFGTGYSSLSYLRSFPFDKIKIDQSFIRQLPGDHESAAIVRAIATLGLNLGMKTTAEGVETQAQAAFIIAEGCDQLQGYLFSKPVPFVQIRAMFAAEAETGPVKPIALSA